MTINCLVEIELEPLYFANIPEVIVSINNETTSLVLAESTTIKFNFATEYASTYVLSVEYTNKQTADTDIVNNRDTAVILKTITLNGITDPKFIWLGKYKPDYPAPYVKDQIAQGIPLASELTNTTYLGWNGVWELEFTTPVYTWIHKVKNLGRIYPNFT